MEILSIGSLVMKKPDHSGFFISMNQNLNNKQEKTQLTGQRFKVLECLIGCREMFQFSLDTPKSRVATLQLFLILLCLWLHTACVCEILFYSP